MSRIIAAGYLVMKVERAQVHLKALNSELDALLKEPYTVIRKNDAENGRHIKRTQMKSLPPIIGMLTGEFFYCLRSGLDQMAWHLALARARRDHPTIVSFPIFESIAKGDDRRNYKGALAFFPDEVAKEIDALQPHKGPDPFQDHPLWQMNKLCNFDKHSIIPIHSMGANVFIPRNPGVRVQHFNNEDALEVSVPIKDKDQLDFQPNLTGDIEFGEWNSDLVIPRHRLNDIHNFFTNTVIPKFERFMLAAETGDVLRLYKRGSVYR